MTIILAFFLVTLLTQKHFVILSLSVIIYTKLPESSLKERLSGFNVGQRVSQRCAI